MSEAGGPAARVTRSGAARPVGTPGPVGMTGRGGWGLLVRHLAHPGLATNVATAFLGAAMVVLPAFSLSGRGQVLTVAGLLLVTVSLASPLARWRETGTLAAVTAVAEAVLGRPGLATLAAEGLLILGYLLIIDAPDAMPGRVALSWLRLQLPGAAWGALACAAVLGVLAVPVPVSAWLVVAGAGAAVAATVVALGGRSREPGEPG
jgi:hypothetical protein